MNPPPIRTPPAVEFVDMTVGLIVFGALTVVFGALFLLLSPLIVLTAKPAAAASGMPVRWLETFTNAMGFAVMGATLIAAGLGSMRRRRWARTLLGIFSWSAFLVMLLIFGLVFFFLKDIATSIATNLIQSQNPEMAGVMVHVQLFRALLFLAPLGLSIPGLWVWFYSMRSVRLTCEAHDAEPGWTERVPPLVLTVSLGLALSAPMVLMGALTHHGYMPFFGTQLTGFAGGMVSVVLAGLWAYAAWATYELKRSGWWIATVSMLLLLFSAWLTWARGDLSGMLAASGLPEKQIHKLQPMLETFRPMILWGTLLFHVPIFGTMLAIWRHFKPSPADR